jgi:hypothetical protein
MRIRLWGFVPLLALGAALPAFAGPIFLTGHDPDFHAQDSVGAQNLLRTGLSFVTNGTFDDGAATKFLWIESRIATPLGHRVGEAGLTTIGLTLGVHYDRANAAEFASINLSSYTAIAVASSFGGLLTRAELDALIAREADIASFVNAGGGLMALAQCFGAGCCANLLDGQTPPDLFGFLPVQGVVPAGANPPFTVTAAGAAAPFNLTNADVNDPTHNSFSSTGGLIVLDTQIGGNAVTLAGNVRVVDDEFVPTPEPGLVGLLGSCLAGLAFARRRRG